MAFWKNLARIGLMAAPYVAAPFTGGSSLLLAGIGSGAGAALGGMDGGLKGALIGAGMGALPGATAGLNAGTQAALQAGASAGLSTLQPGGLSTMRGQPVIPTPPPGTAQPSIWSRLGSVGRNPDTWEAASKMIAAATEASARNRPALADVSRAEYVARGGQAYTPPDGTPRYGFGPEAPSDRLRDRASDLEEELFKRLTPSIWERIGTFAAPAAGIYSTVLR